MNILGFITGLLMIFAISSYSLWEKGISQNTIDISYQGYLEASRKAQNNWESNKYKSKKNIEKKKVTSPLEITQTSSAPNTKKVIPLLECSRINIFPLFEGDKEIQKDLYQLLAKMITTHYSQKPFFQKALRNEKRAVDKMITEISKAAKLALKEENKPFYLEKLNLKNDELQQVYYYMLKGTKNRDINPDGYPSLLSLVKAQKEPEKDKVCLSCASTELLKVLFPSKVANAIYELREKQKITEVALQKIYSDNHYLPSPSLQEMIEPVHKKKKTNQAFTLSGKDKDSDISIERKFHVSS